MKLSRTLLSAPVHVRRLCLGLVLGSGAIGCAKSASSGTRVVSVDHSVITPEELHARNFTNLYDAIQALRGNWLRTRGNDSFETPSIIQVYLDNQRMGGLEQLRSLNPRSVYSVQYFDGIAATARWGLNHGAGAIFVTSQR